MSSILLVFPALVTWLALGVYFFVFLNAGRSRRKHNVLAPSMDGPPEFLRAQRVQTNTVEQLVFFLPALWLFALYMNPLWAAILGSIWVIGRIIYALAYYKEASKRTAGFIISAFATLILWVGSLWGIINVILVLTRISQPAA
ncbi:MAG: MAPEG family protein [Alphaproteobacteria bacterium]|nr:MAPEG family protein [Alphaproteobacteria bacterium]